MKYDLSAVVPSLVMVAASLVAYFAYQFIAGFFAYRARQFSSQAALRGDAGEAFVIAGALLLIGGVVLARTAK